MSFIRAVLGGTKLHVTADVDSPRENVTLRVTSSRNDHIPSLTERSPHAPNREVTERARSIILGQQMFFPTVDISLEPDMAARIEFSGEGVGSASYSVNGLFRDNLRQALATGVVPASELEHWENAVFVEGDGCVPVRFALELTLPAADGKIEHDFTVLSAQWSGTIEAVDDGGNVLVRSKVLPPRWMPPARAVDSSISRGTLLASLEDTLGYLLRSQNTNPGSRTFNGLYLFYDHDAQTFRTSHWNWAWGPSVRLFLDSRKYASELQGTSVAHLEKVAHEVGEAGLRFQINDPGSPADGFAIVRWSPGLRNQRQTEYVSPSSPDFPVDGWAPSHAGEHFVRGFEAYVSPADALFTAGWGWMPLYRELGDRRFFDATQRMVAATDALLQKYEVVPQDMPVAVNQWTDYTREEAGFGMVGLAEFGKATGSVEDRAIGERYIDALLSKLERPDGLWNRHWWRSGNRQTGCEYKSRSLGWATMGLLSSHELSPERGYLDKAARLADHFVALQKPEGYWGLVINKPIEETEISVKGTSLWSMLLYQLHAATGEEKYLIAGRKALGWLLAQQYRGDDSDGYGGLISCSAFSGVDYRRWFKLSCSYSSSFFGLAVLQELALQTESR
jgi:hypothetical protein